ncbi:hypothetical protein GN244_ATG08893 [Phytophthora infestans]|uniref:Uncharacterized protein n=1 Tax=Phytophthora infestans TaxID=4787 RepID=A0A833SBX1_PHYIN|nr:hypothetical protein GN244_ATG08893 [Phytophthora infestans]
MDTSAGPTIQTAYDEVGEEPDSVVKDPDDAAAGSKQLHAAKLVVPADGDEQLSVENALAEPRSANRGGGL